VDSVHQGDLDKEKGVYHINLVDEVTQEEVMATVEGISEYFLIPALEDALAQFKVNIINFHSDNGSARTDSSACMFAKTTLSSKRSNPDI